VAGVDGAALGDVDVAGVGQLGVFLEVGRGDRERLGPRAVGVLTFSDHSPARTCARHAGNAQRVAVGEGPPGRVDLAVQPGPHQVTATGSVAI
jgi:hypothetical protein